MADSGNELTSWFCNACGSALFAQNSVRPRIRTLYVGTLDNPEVVQVSTHIWIKRRLPWVILPQEHRIFDGAGDWSEDYISDMRRYVARMSFVGWGETRTPTRSIERS